MKTEEAIEVLEKLNKYSIEVNQWTGDRKIFKEAVEYAIAKLRESLPSNDMVECVCRIPIISCRLCHGTGIFKGGQNK